MVKNGFNGHTWPKNLFAFGHDGCGDYYFINLESNNQNIYYADHECDFDLENKVPYAKSMKEFLDLEIEIENEIKCE